ncbi:MAG: NADH-quinone oxidoreductase subunit NuoF [Candidatus Omnitrophica bacterium]|nr:NADH-quinone oxidoreductase subunit F [bacterium]NUN97989.1 NADH-quinone oxidoreductase subunit NuoF [Candidatus Omnitrophota bacterium]
MSADPLKKPLTRNIDPTREPFDLKQYEAAGGYQAVAKVLKMDPKEVTETVKNSGLRGRGGAGFNTGLKWSFVPMGPDAPRPKYLICNADEMEPGTMKDRVLLEGDPHSLIEGMICAAYAIQAEKAFIFLRWGYTLSEKRLRKALAEAYEGGWLGKNIKGSGYSLDLIPHISAGRYICGEETALINALEGKRANPRTKPPFPQVSGLFGKPTIVNNVETFCNIPPILTNGVEWYKSLGLTEDAGTKLYGASGKVKRPGVWELPMGTPIREILEGHAGGMREGLRFKGLLPGGASTDFLVEEHLDLPMDYASIQKAGSRLGTGTMIVLDDQTCVVGMVLNLTQFFAQESCGWCTPCRDGLAHAVKLLQAIKRGEGRMEDLNKLDQLCRFMGPGNTFCALAPGAAEPIQSALKYFRADFERLIPKQPMAQAV